MAYMPSITFPPSFFASPYASIATPLILGMGSGLVAQPGRSVPKKLSDPPSADRTTFVSSTRATQEKYMSLKQPPLRPPPWLFAPAWTTLYLLMGYASHRAWMTGMHNLSPARVVEDTRRGATLYSIQLGLNLIFMPLFFGFGLPVPALVDVAALTGVVGYLTYVWAKVDRVAMWCMVPYLGWCTFATYLTAGTGYLNKWDLRGKTVVEKKE